VNVVGKIEGKNQLLLIERKKVIEVIAVNNRTTIKKKNLPINNVL
jgi:hypothetical protein